MDISGFGYFIFFLCVLGLHALLAGRDRLQKAMLTLASYYFYATVDWRFPILLLTLTLINWGAGEAVGQAQDRRTARQAVALAVLASVAILAYFKYLNFFGGMLNGLSAWLGGGALVPVLKLLLPVGISFMTFQAISYPIDLYAGRLARRASLADFMLFMAFFPRLLAGPIVPAAQFLPQLQQAAQPVTDEQRFSGAALIMRGLVKKVLLADLLGAHLVDPVFARPADFSAPFVWLAMFGYSLQAYYDLSGYTDMALGAARMLGYRLPSNFNRPYMATGIANFWQRWHITMSSFFRNYLYNPLSSAWRAPVGINLLIVFVAIGLWHGAGWNFVVYGLIHGSMVALEHWRSTARQKRGLPLPVYRGGRLVLQIGLVFAVVSLTRVLFRSTDFAGAGGFFAALAGPLTGAFPLSPQAGLALLAALGLHFTPMRWRDAFMAWVARQPAWLFGAQFAGLVYVVSALSQGASGFIYYQF
ncbi:MBOAT family O-acyltransferase [Pseudoduganella sp. UC29_106]|uniref:MBOAT family O-acyltransferase n=1 Tax=Pseudoduganella sp. UC29_106 TaxID=3374553 RepID=UPI0037568BAB